MELSTWFSAASSALAPTLGAPQPPEPMVFTKLRETFAAGLVEGVKAALPTVTAEPAMFTAATKFPLKSSPSPESAPVNRTVWVEEIGNQSKSEEPDLFSCLVVEGHISPWWRQKCRARS